MDLRIAIWSRYVPGSVAEQIDFSVLAEASNGMTPADLEYAARRASQEALARANGASLLNLSMSSAPPVILRRYH